MSDKIVFCKGGGCTAKLGAGVLSHILERLPKGPRDENLLIGFESRDDGAVYKLTEDLAIVQTLDFFPPMVDDPYVFGRIAAANALSDVYAMGGEVRTALNIVCFPEDMDLNILGEILRGGSEMVLAAGGSLVGGHSIADDSVKYGLSVTGVVHPDRMYPNNQGRPGDWLILTKKLGTGIICTADRIGEASEAAMAEAVASMTTLNRDASRICRDFEIHGCTDVTGFGFLGHLHEMLDGNHSALVDAGQVPVLKNALDYADEFFLTAAGQRNRNYVEGFVQFQQVPFAMEEVLLDPQTSGGLLIAAAPGQAETLLARLREAGLPAAKVGEIVEKGDVEILVKG